MNECASSRSGTVVCWMEQERDDDDLSNRPISTSPPQVNDDHTSVLLVPTEVSIMEMFIYPSAMSMHDV